MIGDCDQIDVIGDCDGSGVIGRLLRDRMLFATRAAVIGSILIGLATFSFVILVKSNKSYSQNVTICR